MQLCITLKQNIIPVVINSVGGSICDVYHMIAAIKACPYTVVTIVCGMAHSAAALLFSFGNERYVSEDASIMIHDLSIEAFGGKANDVKMEGREMTRANKYAFRQMATNSAQKKNFYLEIIKRAGRSDVYLTASKAIEYGLATHVGVPTLQLEWDVRLVMKV